MDSTGPEPACQRQCPSLDDVLRELSVPAARDIYHWLRFGSSLSDVRLSCRALRDLVDCNVTYVRFTPAKHPPSLSGRPCLERWPRLSEVTLCLEGDESPSSLLILPFVGQPEEARARITSLALCWNEEYMGPSLPPPTFMQLASLLPNLRDLDLGGLRGGILPTKTLDLYFFYSNLSQLRSLEALRLPTAALLPGIEALAGRLKCLNIQGFHVGRNDGDTHMSVKAIASVRQLSKLTALAVHGPAFYPAGEEGGGAGGQASGGLRDLLDALPPALESLCWGGGDPEFMSIWLRKDDGHDGRWALTVGSCSFSDLFELFARALRPCRALRSAERPRLILENMTATALEGRDEETLQALLRLYDISMETELVVDSSCGLEDLQRVLGLLRAVPDLGFRGFPNDRYGVSFARPEGGLQQAETAARPLLAPVALLELALDSMAARKPTFDESLQGFRSLMTPTRLLARGPAAAAASQLEPDALREWAVQVWAAQVERRAQAAALAAGSGGRPRAVEAEAEDGSSRVRLSGVRALPPAAALVVECRWARGTAEAVAAALEGEGLQVVTLCQESVTVESLGYTSLESSFEGNLHWGLQHALHAAWDAALPITTLSERLEWVLAVRDMLKDLPARVKVP